MRIVQIYTFYKVLLLYKFVEILTFDEIFCNCAREDVVVVRLPL